MDKRLLPAVLPFQIFMGRADGLRLKPDTVALLGLNSPQAAMLDEGLASLLAQFSSSETDHLARSTVHASDRWPNGKKTSYRIPPLKEEMQSAVDAFFASVGGTLAPSQAEIFEGWAKAAFSASLGNFGGKARIFTFTDEGLRGGRTLTRFEVAEENGKHSR